MNPDPGGLTIIIDDESTTVEMTGGGRWSMPVGPLTLVADQLERRDVPSPAHLTNALGHVEDHFDDVILDSPMVGAAPSVEFAGAHAMALAAVELGTADVPDDYVLQRADGDEVFRTLVAEPIAERHHNPGLDPERAESIIGVCCVILAIIRRLDLQHATIRSGEPTPS